MRPRSWASSWTILAARAGVVALRSVYPLLNPDPQLAYWSASQRTDEPLVIVLLIGLIMAANYMVLGDALEPAISYD